MGLSPEERRKIYEEEKTRIEEEEKSRGPRTEATTGLRPNVAGLLCYVGFWVSGIIFLILEQEDRFVRFHAIQSIITFGVLMTASGVLGWIPYVGAFFRVVIGILTFVLWIVLMSRAYRGEWYKLPVAGDIAAGIVPPGKSSKAPETAPETKSDDGPAQASLPYVEAAAERISEGAKRLENRMDAFFSGTRAGRVASSGFTIAWSLVWLVFFSFFSDYIAYYEQVSPGNWVRHPLLTGEYFDWLPILITSLLLSITGHIILIIHDRYWLRETVLIVLNLAGLAAVIGLAVIFPFDFSVFPNSTLANVLPIIVRLSLIAVSIGLSVGTLVMFIKLLVNVLRPVTD